jgi:endonuclease-3
MEPQPATQGKQKRARLVKCTADDEQDAADQSAASQPSPRTKAKKASRKSKEGQAGGRGRGSGGSPRSSAASVPLSPPTGWRETYDLITELRADRTAVVDTMGCEAINESADEETQAYQTLISLMLSSQTKDTVNAATMEKLRAHGLSVGNVLATPDDVLHDLIRGVGFHNNKVRYIKQATQILQEQHGGKVPDTMDALLALPGVGPKMALITLHVAFGKVEGISVDTHVHRICNQLGWAGAAGTKQPEATRKIIEGWMPREVWPEVNLLLVGLGQEVQTERPKLLSKALASSDPLRALRLCETLGVPVERVLKATKLTPPDGYVPGEGLLLEGRGGGVQVD